MMSGSAKNWRKRIATTESPRKTYRNQFDLKSHVLNLSPNKGSSAFKIKLLNTVSPIKNHGLKISETMRGEGW